jgi:hypothetical protein
MRSRTCCSIHSGEVHAWAVSWLLEAKLVKDHGWKCTAAMVLNVVLRAAARSISISAACRDLARAPSDQALITALDEGLPKTPSVLERRLNEALTGQLPRRWTRRRWEVAIDWHLTPYYGQPFRSQNELYYGQPRQGTKQFHAYASACLIDHGERYTVALTTVRRHESTVTVPRRLLARMRELGLKFKRVLVDRAFFNVAVVEFFQQEKLPFVMPVVFRGRRPKQGKKLTGLHAIRRKKAGWYKHVMKNKRRAVEVPVCVGYRTHKNRQDGKRVQRKLLFAAWRVKGSPTKIRELYRKRFGIETSFRQLRQARIYTCTRNPRLRFFFIALALILRNLWVWIHHALLAKGDRNHRTLHLERLRFKRMLDWIVHEIAALIHDGARPCTVWPP